MAIIDIAPMKVSGVQHLVERAYRESGLYQYLRELLTNALEAGASRIEFGPEWQAVATDGVYRLMVADNGSGMGPDELLRFLNTFGGGGKPIGDAHENYGVGAKTSLLPWNHHGVVVISWTADTPDGSMIQLARDPKSGEYGAKKFETPEGFEEVVTPFGEWATVKPSWIGDHGTVVICLGNTGTEDTFLGKDGDGDIKGISAYLNKRLWEVPAGVEIYVQELRSQKKADWPRSLAEASGTTSGGVDRRWNRRQIMGARYFVRSAGSGKKGRLSSEGVVPLSDGTRISWYLWRGDRPNVHSYAHMNGYIAAQYKNELYDTQKHISHFRSFGITQSEVRANLTLIAQPPKADGSYGVYPDTARNALKIQGSKRAGEALPWAEWAQEFAENMPEEIREALAKAGPSRTGSMKDSSWKDRLIDRFGSRWKSLRFLLSKKGEHRIDPDLGGSTGGASGKGGGGGGGGGTNPGPNGAGQPQAARNTVSKGGEAAKAAQRRGGVPEYEWTTLDNIDENKAYAAAWSPPSAERPNGVVQIARDFQAIVEVKKFWRAHYPDHLGDQIDGIIEEVYGEAMVARIAHSEQLVSDPCWGRSKVEQELRSPVALTMALLGLFSEDQHIRGRLSALGRRRSDKNVKQALEAIA